MKNRRILIFSICLFWGIFIVLAILYFKNDTQTKENTEGALKTINSNKTEDSPKKKIILEPVITPFVIASSVYSKSKNYEIELAVFSNSTSPDSIITFDLSNSKYNEAFISKYGYQEMTVQFNSSLDKFYFVLEKSYAFEAEFDWSKLIEYDYNKKKFREILSDESSGIDSWYYEEFGNKIYTLDNKTGNLIAIDLKTLKTEILFSFYTNEDDETSHDVSIFEFYQLEDDSLVILCSTDEVDFLEICINTNTNEVKENIHFMKREYFGYDNKNFPASVLYNFDGYYRYNNNIVIATYSNFKTKEQLIKIYSEEESKSWPVDFKNSMVYWVDKYHFIVKVKDDNVSMHENLNCYDDKFVKSSSYQFEKVNIIAALGDGLLISYSQPGINKTYLALYYHNEFNGLRNIDGFNINEILSVKKLNAVKLE